MTRSELTPAAVYRRDQMAAAAAALTADTVAENLDLSGWREFFDYLADADKVVLGRVVGDLVDSVERLRLTLDLDAGYAYVDERYAFLAGSR